MLYSIDVQERKIPVEIMRKSSTSIGRLVSIKDLENCLGNVKREARRVSKNSAWMRAVGRVAFWMMLGKALCFHFVCIFLLS